MSKNMSLEQSLQAYRVMNTPTQLSWKQHWANETFTNDSYIECNDDEKKQFLKRLEESECTICDNIKQIKGNPKTLKSLLFTLLDKNNENVSKINRKVIYSTSNGERPIGKKAFELWNGFQVIDMDIKDAKLASQLKQWIFDHLKKCNWFLGVALSSSGKGLHIYTKITIPESEDDVNKKKLLYLTNFRHKYSFVYIVCINAMEKFNYTKDQLLQWMDLAMFKPQQGAFIGYDSCPLINTHYFEDFIYVNFDQDLSGEDWMTYPDLKEIFKRWEWFENESDDLKIEVREAKDLEIDTHNKTHYKHNDRWRLANTLVKLYGMEKGYQYLRMICSNAIKDKELQADCITAARHNKPVDVWAVNRLNSIHGFKIKLNISDTSFDESEIYKSIDQIDNPTMIRESDFRKDFHLTSKEYLGTIRHELLSNIGRVTLIEAGAGVGKTEMVKALVRDGKKVILVMPFTSTIKSKVENEKDWTFSYGNYKVRLDQTPGVAMTIDKFSRMNLMDIKAMGFDYIIIDESHLLFQSEYRSVMPKVIEMIRNTEVPIVMMSGTPSGEMIFFPDIVHLKVVKDDTRQKEFKVYFTETASDQKLYMCKHMARDISNGLRILFPTNKGTIFSKEIKAMVQQFLEDEYFIYDEVNLQYYKKSNVGEQFMDDVNFEKTIKDTQILMCSSYLSVGVDILDRYKFSIYFDEQILPQEIEQYANRLRSNDLFINMYVSKRDADGNLKNVNRFREMNFKMNDEEIKSIHSIIQICNDMLRRNKEEYKYNSLIASIINQNTFIEYNEIDNKYYLNDIAYKTVYFERKYRDYAQQLPVLMKGMKAYGYLLSSKDLCEFESSKDVLESLKNRASMARDEQTNLNTQHIEELMDIITEDRLGIYKNVLAGEYDIRKGSVWEENAKDHIMIVKNIEMFEKVVPIFVSMSKMFAIKDIKDIFNYCRNKNGSFNFSAIKRIRVLINMVYNSRNHRLDLPIQEFMEETYKLVKLKKINKLEIIKFIRDFAIKYAVMASTDDIIITRSEKMMAQLNETFTNIFRCLVEVSRPNKMGIVTLKKVELLWKEKTYYNEDGIKEKMYMLADFLNDNVEVSDVQKSETKEM